MNSIKGYGQSPDSSSEVISVDLSEVDLKSENELETNIKNVKKYLTNLKEDSDEDSRPRLDTISSGEEREIEYQKQEKAKQFPVKNIENLKNLHQIELQMHRNNIDFLTMKKVFHLDFEDP